MRTRTRKQFTTRAGPQARKLADTNGLQDHTALVAGLSDTAIERLVNDLQDKFDSHRKSTFHFREIGTSAGSATPASSHMQMLHAACVIEWNARTRAPAWVSPS